MPERSGAGARIVRFGVFELDLRSGELRKAGTRVTLQEQPLQILTVLLEQPGELVSRDELRTRLWPAETFVDFEHGLNAAVKRLRDTLGDSADTPRFIETLPRRGYRFIAPVQRPFNQSEEPAQPGSQVPSPSDLAPGSQAGRHPAGEVHVRWISTIVAIGVVVAMAFGWLLTHPRTPDPGLKVVPLTAFSGIEWCPSFSPDGKQIAFTWNGEKRDNFDVYVMLVGSSSARRLTTNPADEGCPRWSPDGQQIAYLRALSDSPRTNEIHVMSPLGGGDMKLSDVPVQGPANWSPDGQFIVAGRDPAPGVSNPGLYLFPVSVSGGEPRPITVAPPSGVHKAASFSPDGRHLVYASCSEGFMASNCDLFVVDLDRTLAPIGAARQLTRQASFGIYSTTAWTRDGRSVVYDVNEVEILYLWRIAVDGHAPPERLEVAGVGAYGPAMSPSLNRLSFSRDLTDYDVFRFEVGRASQSFLTSSLADGNPQFSPDGQRVTFCSNRSGSSMEVWVAAGDGSNATQLTHGPGRWQCSPRWSPDGKRIAFDSRTADGHWHIWTIDADGGIPHQVTKNAGDQNIPSWSKDGVWIYSSWNQGNGGREIWRTRASTGTQERVRGIEGSAGSFLAIESPDGNSVLYQPQGPNSALMSAPLASGDAVQLVPCVAGTAFSTGPRGIYYVACGPGSAPEVHVINPATAVDQVLGRLDGFEREVPSGFTVSPDGTSILYTRPVSQGVDLMLIENFR